MCQFWQGPDKERPVFHSVICHSGHSAPSQFQRQGGKRTLVVEALTSNAEGGRGEIQASSVKMQAQASKAQSWWGGLCSEVT